MEGRLNPFASRRQPPRSRPSAPSRAVPVSPGHLRRDWVGHCPGINCLFSSSWCRTRSGVTNCISICLLFILISFFFILFSFFFFYLFLFF